MNNLIVFDGIIIDPVAYRVTFCKQKVELSRLQFELLLYLVNRPNRVCNYDELLDQVWEYEEGGNPALVQLAACRLRKKFGNKLPIATVRGVGLRFDGFSDESA